MKTIVLVSHGTFAKGIYEAASMIYGDLKNVSYLCLEKNMGIDSFKKQLEKLIENVKDFDQIIVLADLKGGSPYTSSVTLLSEKELLSKSKIISGLNLPLLLSVLFIDEIATNEVIDEAIISAKDGIEKFEIIQNENEDL